MFLILVKPWNMYLLKVTVSLMRKLQRTFCTSRAWRKPFPLTTTWKDSEVGSNAPCFIVYNNAGGQVKCISEQYLDILCILSIYVTFNCSVHTKISMIQYDINNTGVVLRASLPPSQMMDGSTARISMHDRFRICKVKVIQWQAEPNGAEHPNIQWGFLIIVVGCLRLAHRVNDPL